jgi:transposase
MGPNFLECDRDRVLLLSSSLREWLPAGHLAWFVIDAVERLDLTAFYVACRLDGQGRAAYESAMMVALLLYSYAVGERSSRRIERRCVEDVATRVICANRVPDHTTIARFRQRHEAALAELFGEVLWLCGEAGLVRVGVIAVDGTQVQANASQHATRGYEQIAREILEHADASMPRRTSASARRAAMSCPSSCLRRRAGSAGCVTRAGAWTSAARGKRARSPGHGPSGSRRPSAAWKRTTRCISRPTPPTRTTAATAG